MKDELAGLAGMSWFGLAGIMGLAGMDRRHAAGPRALGAVALHGLVIYPTPSAEPSLNHRVGEKIER